LVEGMILDGHLRPIWAEGYEPVRVGDELGWREAPGTDPFDRILRNPSEPICSSDSLYREFLSERRGEREETRTWEYLFIKKNLPAQWNSKTDQPMWFKNIGLGEWVTSAEMILSLTFQALERRAKGPYQKLSLRHARSLHDLHRNFAALVEKHPTETGDCVRAAVLLGKLTHGEADFLMLHFFTNKTVREIAEIAGTSCPTVTYRLNRALRNLQPSRETAREG
jgi:hypothetical protein